MKSWTHCMLRFYNLWLWAKWNSPFLLLLIRADANFTLRHVFQDASTVWSWTLQLKRRCVLENNNYTTTDAIAPPLKENWRPWVHCACKTERADRKKRDFWRYVCLSVICMLFLNLRFLNHRHAQQVVGSPLCWTRTVNRLCFLNVGNWESIHTLRGYHSRWYDNDLRK